MQQRGRPLCEAEVGGEDRDYRRGMRACISDVYSGACQQDRHHSMREVISLRPGPAANTAASYGGRVKLRVRGERPRVADGDRGEERNVSSGPTLDKSSIEEGSSQILTAEVAGRKGNIILAFSLQNGRH